MKIRLFAVLMFIVSAGLAFAEFPINYSVSLTGNVSSDDNFAPYYISSNVHGIVTQSQSALMRAKASHDMDLNKRFSFGFGADLIGGVTSSALYQRYNVTDGSWYGHKERPASFWLHQLYGEVKYRGLFLTAGLKEHQSALFNSSLGSGDLVESGNSRPIPEIRMGFVDFQNVPFTNGWVQVQGEYSFGKTTDNDWLENHYNYYNANITTDTYYSYKRFYLRSKPSCPFSVTVGMQSGVFTGGNAKYYRNGKVWKEYDMDLTFKSWFHTIIPGNEGTGVGSYNEGSTLGSWDLVFRYRLKNDDELKLYMQSPWEDGSGIGKLNGWDGVWGFEYKSARPWYVNGVVVEYIDFRNQSGPLHWAPADHPDIPQEIQPGQATGSDNYYNNYQFNGYQYYGMSIGSPFIKSPIYNLDGTLSFNHNRIQGFHMGVSGNIIPQLSYRFLLSYRKSLGTYSNPTLEKLNDTSAMLEAEYTFKKVKGLKAKCQLAIDRGTLYGDNFGGLFTVSYDGLLKF